jgi:hypothetical protein
MARAPQIPVVDPHVHHVPLSRLHGLTSADLAPQTETWVVRVRNGEWPIAVVLPYETFLAMQRALETVDADHVPAFTLPTCDGANYRID